MVFVKNNLQPVVELEDLNILFFKSSLKHDSHPAETEDKNDNFFGHLIPPRLKFISRRLAGKKKGRQWLLPEAILLFKAGTI